MQDDVGGLQVFSEGDWIDVPNNLGPGVLGCNLGEQAEILSRGYFLATPHRVLANQTGHTERISIPLFYNPTLSSAIEPLVAEGHNIHLEGARGERKHWRMKANTMLATVGDNTFKSLARSHPAVFQRHHSDLILLEDGRIVRK
jgi:isopenicillin N synthase-like dioxygenase